MLGCMQVTALETDILSYLKDLLKLPFYPTSPTDCDGDKAVFCKGIWK